MKLFIYSLVIALFMTSCLTPDQKARTFVEQYNKANKNPFSGMRKNFARYDKDGTITIKIYTSFKSDEMGLELIKNSMPEIIGGHLLNDPKVKELLELDKEFDVYVYDAYNKQIVKETVSKDSPYSPLKAKETNISSFEGQELSTIISILNKNLPITDEMGITLSNINVNRGDLVYTAEIPDDLKDLFEIEGVSDLLKEELVKDTNLINALRQTQKYKIENIVYKYVDKKGNTLKEVKISSADLFPFSK